ncbi:Uncharacterized protein Fot_14370 [Forsythia ovata]|uniref:Uncharacterized protein n=1 Tax=Forsythia ovata TaxID=205694 RepID=A0ABD1W6F0_9LAMI
MDQVRKPRIVREGSPNRKSRQSSQKYLISFDGIGGIKQSQIWLQHKIHSLSSSSTPTYSQIISCDFSSMNRVESFWTVTIAMVNKDPKKSKYSLIVITLDFRRIFVTFWAPTVEEKDKKKVMDNTSKRVQIDESFA